MNTTDRKQYTSINQIISEAQSAGSHFFDEATLRFFSSRIKSNIYGGCYFITSERDNYRDSNPRFYTISNNFFIVPIKCIQMSTRFINFSR